MIKYRLKNPKQTHLSDLLEVTKVVSRKTGSSDVSKGVCSRCNEQNTSLCKQTESRDCFQNFNFFFFSEIYLEYHSLFHILLSSFKFLIQQEHSFHHYSLLFL